MPVFTEVGPEAMARIVNKNQVNGVSLKVAPYLDFVKTMTPDIGYTLQPEGDETLRSIRVNMTKAANFLGIRLQYSEEADGTLLVAIDTREKKVRKSKKNSEQAQESSN